MCGVSSRNKISLVLEGLVQENLDCNNYAKIVMHWTILENHFLKKKDVPGRKSGKIVVGKTLDERVIFSPSRTSKGI